MSRCIFNLSLFSDDLEPAYVINPGEIATRNNATLLQKYFDDPFMSPYLADDQTLADLPPIHIVVRVSFTS